jgi:hypothetical protein
VPLRRTLRRGPALPCRRHCCEWPPRAVPARVGVSDFWVLDLRCMGPLLHTRASPMASLAISAYSGGPSGWFRAAPVARVYTRHCFFFFPLVALAFLCFWVCFLVFGVLLYGFWGFSWVWGVFFFGCFFV